jgi:hypothetical protein
MIQSHGCINLSSILTPSGPRVREELNVLMILELLLEITKKMVGS